MMIQHGSLCPVETNPLVRGVFFNMDNQKNVILYGIQPSGDLHPGNYLGALQT